MLRNAGHSDCLLKSRMTQSLHHHMSKSEQSFGLCLCPLSVSLPHIKVKPINITRRIKLFTC